MGQSIQALGIVDLSFDERIALVQDIWDSVAIEAGLLPPSAAECAELDSRIVDDDANPNDCVAWETVKAQALARWK